MYYTFNSYKFKDEQKRKNRKMELNSRFIELIDHNDLNTGREKIEVSRRMI